MWFNQKQTSTCGIFINAVLAEYWRRRVLVDHQIQCLGDNVLVPSGPGRVDSDSEVRDGQR